MVHPGHSLRPHNGVHVHRHPVPKPDPEIQLKQKQQNKACPRKHHTKFKYSFKNITHRFLCQVVKVITGMRTKTLKAAAPKGPPSKRALKPIMTIFSSLPQDTDCAAAPVPDLPVCLRRAMHRLRQKAPPG